MRKVPGFRQTLERLVAARHRDARAGIASMATPGGQMAAAAGVALVLTGVAAGIHAAHSSSVPAPSSNPSGTVALASPGSEASSPLARPSPSPAAAPAPSGQGSTVRTGPGGAAASSNPVDRTPVRTSTGWVYNPASVYSGATDFTGISPAQINICMHAAITLGPAFNERASDVSVYWNWLNQHGGVIGRQVNFEVQDDKYTAQGAQLAMQNCEQMPPFMVLGGIGFDQDPAVRTLAEQNAVPYVYTMADDGSTGTGPPHQYTYSFSASPTIEQVGTWLAQATLKNLPGPYGAVYVSDANWQGGYLKYRAYMDAHGGSSVDANAYTMNSGADNSEFNVYITKLQAAGVKTVYLWMNAVGMDEFVASAHQQNYNPAYITPDGFDLVTGTVGQDIDTRSSSVAPALAGWITPAFDPNNSDVPWWPQEKEMLDAYSSLDSGHQPDDIDWMAWLSFKSVTDLLNTCGVNCDRNDLLGVFDSGWRESLAPLCTTDFSANRNFGGLYMNLWRATRVPYVSVDYPSAGQHTVWQQVQTCGNSFG